MKLLFSQRRPRSDSAIHLSWPSNLKDFFRPFLAVAVLALLLVPGAVVFPQTNTPPPGVPDQSLPQSILTGWINVLHGDPPPNSNLPYHQLVVLNDAQGNTLAELSMDAETAESYFGREVEVAGRVTATSGNDEPLPRLGIEMIQPVENDLPQASGNSIVTGSQPWVNILCKFPDIANLPRQPAAYQAMFSSTFPGLDHYWRQTSYDNINLAGTSTTSKWVVLPLPRNSYLNSNGSAELDRLVTDCTRAADSLVHYPSFVGINMMFNADLDCCAWGGTTVSSLDGQTKTYRITWLPPWSQVYSTIAHEMGHGFGFPHSTGPADDPPSELNIYVSDWDVMSSSDGTCLLMDAQPPNGYGCYPVGTIAYNLDTDGWIAANRRAAVYPGETKTVTLEQLQLPVSTTNPLIARIPIGGSSLHFYTVEARFGSGYDQNSPAVSSSGAVVIHDIDLLHHGGNGGLAYVVDALETLSPIGCLLNYVVPLPLGCNDLNDDVNDAGSRWTVGETFSDAGNSISVSVLNKGSSSFTVQIANYSAPQPYPDAPSELKVAGVASSSVTLQWQDNAFNETGFKIYKWETCDGILTFCLHATVGANVTTYTDSAVQCNTGLYYEISAYNNYAESDLTPYVYVHTDPCSATDAAPSLNSYPSSTVVLTWSGVSWAVNYEVQIDNKALFSAAPFDSQMVGANTLYARFTLNKGIYYWRVRALDATGKAGAWSTPQPIEVAG